MVHRDINTVIIVYTQEMLFYDRWTLVNTAMVLISKAVRYCHKNKARPDNILRCVENICFIISAFFAS